MTELLYILNWLLPMLYLALLVQYAAAFFLRKPVSGPASYLPGAIAIHLAFLVLLGWHLRRIAPVNNYEVLSVVAAATAAVYCVVERASREKRTGVFVLLAVFLMQYTSTVFLSSAEQTDLHRPAALARDWKQLHVLPALFAYTAFTISAIHALLHVLAQRNLKQRRFGLLFDRLPPLELLGKMTWHAMLTGFAFLTVACITGAMAHSHASHVGGHWDLKIMAKSLGGVAAWVVYALAIAGKYLFKWDPARVSRVVLGGFALVILILVSSIVLS